MPSAAVDDPDPTEPRVRFDATDADIIRLFSVEPRIGVVEASRRLDLARGTVQSRLDRLIKSGIIRDFAPTIDPEALGYPITAFAKVLIRQGGGHAAVTEHVSGVPEVIEMYTVTGDSDVLLKIVARSMSDLQRVVDVIVRSDQIERVSTMIALTAQLENRVLPLVLAAASQD